jgi:hypothetical protein
MQSCGKGYFNVIKWHCHISALNSCLLFTMNQNLLKKYLFYNLHISFFFKILVVYTCFLDSKNILCISENFEIMPFRSKFEIQCHT